MNRIDRLFAIHTYLQSRKYATAEMMANKFSISIRTVYRDVRALCDSGVPVSFEPLKGYFIVQGYFLSPVSFTTEEAAALMLMEGATRVFADKSIQELYSAALTKIRSVLRSTQKEGIDTIAGSMGMQLPPCMEANFDHLSALQTSIAQHMIVEIDYCTQMGERSTRNVEPIGLMYYAMAWHLIGWCHKRMAYRDFKVSRIEKLRATGQLFTISEHISLQEFSMNLPVAY